MRFLPLMSIAVLSLLGISTAVSCQPTDPLPSCDVGLACHGGCVDEDAFLDDVDNCGSCGYPCAAGQLCQSGDCCTPGYDCMPAGTGTTGPAETYCSGEWVDLDSDDAHCGACDNHCGIVEECVSGQCVAEGGTTTSGPGADTGSSGFGSTSSTGSTGDPTGSTGGSTDASSSDESSGTTGSSTTG